MPPVDQTRQYRWQENGKAAYAPRFEQKEWEKHEEDIKSLHAEGRTKNQILHVLDDQHGFRPSYGQLRKRLGRLVPTTASSIATPPPPSSVSQLQPEIEIPESRLATRDAQPTPALTKDEEDEQDVFKTFTSILDDASEPRQTETRASEHSTTPVKEKPNLKATSRSPQNSRTATSAGSPPQANKHTSSSPDKPSHADQTFASPSHPIAVDSSDDDESTRTRPLLPNRSFSSADTQDFEGASRRAHRPSRRKRKHYHSDQDLDSGVSRGPKKTRQRYRFSCCACGKAAYSSACERCGHKRCGGCQSSLAVRQSIGLVAENNL